MDTTNMLKVTGIDLPTLVKRAYELSAPRGLGFLHFTPKPLSEEDVAGILGQKLYDGCVFSMDYVKGRAVKLSAYRDEAGDIWLRDRWYDHTAEDLVELLAPVKEAA